METIVLILIGLGLFGGFWWWATTDNTSKLREVFKGVSGASNVDSGIAELIVQQEQTNKHLKKLIDDFFWFRIGIIGLLIFGGISKAGGFD